MDEQDALKFIPGKVPRSGADAALIQNLLIAFTLHTFLKLPKESMK